MGTLISGERGMGFLRDRGCGRLGLCIGSRVYVSVFVSLFKRARKKE